MIELTERKDIFESKKVIASEVCQIQKAYYDEEIYNYCNENEKIEYLNGFDAIHYNIVPVKYHNKVINFNINAINIYSMELPKILSKLFNEINTTKLYVLSDLKMDFFDAISNKYKPLQYSYKKLREIVSAKKYTEAFCFNKLFIGEIVEILFWLSRCVPCMNNIMIFDFNEKYYFNICQYGNIHFTGINGEIITEEIINKIGLKIVDICKENFGNENGIKGRKIKI